MAFNPSQTESGISRTKEDMIPEGVPVKARCTRVVEIGIQASQYGEQNKAIIGFNVPDYTINIGGVEMQRFLSNPYGLNMSNNEGSDMKKYTNALNRNAQDLGELLNKTCQLSVVWKKRARDGNLFEKIDNVSALMPGVEVADADVPLLWFQWDDPSKDVFDQLPEFTQNLIKEAVNYPGSKVEAIVEGRYVEDEDDLPF